MTRTRYTVNHRGREWYLDESDRHALEYWQQRGAKITAEVMTQDIEGISLTRLTHSELENLNEIAESMDWQYVSRMVREERQQRVES